MKRKALKRSSGNSNSNNKKKKMGLNTGSLSGNITRKLGQVSLFAAPQQSVFQNLLESEANPPVSESTSSPFDFNFDVNSDEKDFILSQDFFW